VEFFFFLYLPSFLTFLFQSTNSKFPLDFSAQA